MTLHTHLSESIKVTLGNDSWLENAANVKTIESHRREFSLQGDDDRPFYKETELPALAIDTKAGGKEQNWETVGEVREKIFAEISTISGDVDAHTAAVNHDTIIKNLERVLQEQITSEKDLGADALVKDVSTETDVPFKKGNVTYYVSRTTFTVDQTRNFELSVYDGNAPGFEDTDEIF